MDIEEIKSKIVDACTDLGSALPYETDQLISDGWDSLADELANLASGVSRSAARLAGYAGFCRRESNKDTTCY